jgi:hypothetical protein
MSTPAERADDLARAERLRAAAALVEEFAPEVDHRQRRDKVDILRRLGLLVAGLERQEDHAICRRCQADFFFNMSWFETRGLSAPRHCDACRAARRRERRRAGVPGNVPREHASLSRE